MKTFHSAQVRVPVGYWLFAQKASDAPPFVPGASTYLNTVFKWAAQYGIGVLVDMHAAPSSQNGCVRDASRASREAYAPSGPAVHFVYRNAPSMMDQRSTRHCCWLISLCLFCTACLHHYFTRHSTNRCSASATQHVRRYEHSAPFRKQETWETNATAIAETVSFVEAIAQEYGGQDALLGISLLNEPTVPHLSPTACHCQCSKTRSAALLLAVVPASLSRRGTRDASA